MNIKKIISSLIIGFSLVAFSGCGKLPGVLRVHKIEEVDQILENFNMYSDFDITYRIEGGAYLASMHIITKTVDNNPQFLIYTYERSGDLRSDNVFYIYNNCIYTDQDSSDEPLIYEYNEAQAPVTTATPVPTTFDFEQINYTLNYVEDLETMKYEIIINDNSFQSLIEELLGDPLVGYTINCSMEVLADKKTKNLESLKIIIQMKEGTSSPITVTSTLTVNALGESVNLNFPSYVTSAIDEYVQYKPLYINTIDNVIKYHNIGLFSDFLYDQKSDSFIVLRDNRLDVYNATTMQFIQAFSDFPADIVEIDVDEGKLVVCYGMKEFVVIDLMLNTDPRTIVVYEYVRRIRIDEGIVIYCTSHSTSDLGFYDINLNEYWYYETRTRVQFPNIDVNYQDHILYVGEQFNPGSDNLIAIDIKSGDKLWIKTISRDNNYDRSLIYEGGYIHYRGKTFRSNDGVLVSNSLLSHDYSVTSSFSPYNTLYDSEKFSIVGHNNLNGRIGIFNYETNSFVYQFSIDYNDICKLNENQYVVTNETVGVIAIVDVSKIDESFIENEAIPIEGIVTSEDGNIMSLKTSRYLHSAVDENYIYILNRETQDLEVYDANTLAFVRSECFDYAASSLDANNHKIAISFKDRNEIIILDSTTWEKQAVALTKPATAVIVNDNKVYFIEKTNFIAIQNTQKADLKVFDTSSGVMSTLIADVYNAQIEINRQDNLLYVKSSIYIRIYNLSTNNLSELIYVSGFGGDLFFDGNFIHIGSSILDKSTGETMLTNTLPRNYLNTVNWQVIKMKFDNDDISIFTGSSQQPFTMVVYDIDSNIHLYTYYGRITDVYKSGDRFILMDGDSGAISILTLD